MMKLSTMKKVMETVDIVWRSPLGEKILENWGYDEGSVFILRASANFVFTFKKAGKPYFLRFNDECERDYETIESEINIVNFLGEQSLNVAKPVRSLNGKFIEVVVTELGTFYAVVFEALAGKHIDYEEISDEQLFLWGKSLGKLHQTLKLMPEKYQANRPNWREHLIQIQELLPANETVAYRELERVFKWAENLSVSKENYGIIHYDFELDNIVFENKCIGMLDFDDCSTYWYVADIVYALRDDGDFSLKSSNVKKFIEGYQRETNLDLELLKEFSWFERFHKLVIYAKLIRSVDIEETEQHPDWLNNLRARLCRTLDDCRCSFEKFD
jgi:Ser/Thr protein kinase RdoA (MazF antagonist)